MDDEHCTAQVPKGPVEVGQANKRKELQHDDGAYQHCAKHDCELYKIRPKLVPPPLTKEVL